mgnify:CR=1 FL=1
MSQHALLCRHLKKINTFLGAKDGALLRSCSRDLAVGLELLSAQVKRFVRGFAFVNGKRARGGGNINKEVRCKNYNLAGRDRSKRNSRRAPCNRSSRRLSQNRDKRHPWRSLWSLRPFCLGFETLPSQLILLCRAKSVEQTQKDEPYYNRTDWHKSRANQQAVYRFGPMLSFVSL